jgi:hypothetical protein
MGKRLLSTVILLASVGALAAIFYVLTATMAQSMRDNFVSGIVANVVTSSLTSGISGPLRAHTPTKRT